MHVLYPLCMDSLQRAAGGGAPPQLCELTVLQVLPWRNEETQNVACSGSDTTIYIGALKSFCPVI